ncbi:GIY-YIG nuclease family protein [Paenibacillus elgii]|uniref:GIY-YIG nuclease family protein n=1 Tax=Paenibacillus elgii TaxID=189691 RepID=UPI00203E1C14|nr:GIY-YIG nuclease family protein [Paenibacillus elgii]MCM3268611.1 GIY-YIG nuclease family protein [Paenibacillus elgii]
MSSNNKKYLVYAYELENGYYYIGQTDNLEQRKREHGTRNGASWTNIHKPKSEPMIIYENIESLSKALFFENSTALLYMKKYGWRNVRGGKFSNTDDEVIYDKLLEYQKNNELEFVIERPTNVPEDHRPPIYSGVNESGEKLDVFNNLDFEIRQWALNSTNGTFSVSTSTLDRLEKFNYLEAAKKWYFKNHTKCRGIIFDEVVKRFEKLKRDKIKRLID